MDLPRYKVDIPLTRPAINKWGIPQKAASLLGLATMLCGMWFGLPYYLVIIPFYLILRGLTEWDHNFWRILSLWWKTKFVGIVFNVYNKRPPWAGSYLSAIPCGVPVNPKGIHGAV